MAAVERNIKKLLIEALERTGDSPEDVRCMYSRRWLDYKKDLEPTMPKSSAADLPEGELSVLFAYSKKYVYTLDKIGTEEVRIKTSTDADSAKIA